MAPGADEPPLCGARPGAKQGAGDELGGGWDWLVRGPGPG